MLNLMVVKVHQVGIEAPNVLIRHLKEHGSRIIQRCWFNLLDRT